MHMRRRDMLAILQTVSLVVLLAGTLTTPSRQAYAVTTDLQATMNRDQPRVATQLVQYSATTWSMTANRAHLFLISTHATVNDSLALVSAIGSNNAPNNAVSSQASAGLTCSARAFGASVAGTLVGDTGLLAATGGDIKGFAGLVNLMGPGYSLVAPTVPGAAALAHVAGCSPSVQSTATMLNFRLTLGGNILSADTAQSQVSGQCGAALSGQTFITGLKLNGVALPAAFDGSVVNATMPLPNGAGTLTVNEQSGGGSGLTVNAIHIRTTGGQDYIFGSAQASVAGCATATPTNIPTNTSIPVPPSATVTVTATSAPATSTSTTASTATNTPALPTATSAATSAATSTATSAVATATSTSTPTPAPTMTNMPTPTKTSTPVPPTVTSVPSTATPVPATATSTMTPTTAPLTATSTPTSTAATAAVSIQDGTTISAFKFNPATLNITVGTKVTWTNNSSTSTIHTTTSDSGNGAGGVWDSGVLAPGQSFSFTFTTPGTFTYHCSIHPFMTGTIHVS